VANSFGTDIPIQAEEPKSAASFHVEAPGLGLRGLCEIAERST
jgi:hypothetical protein